MDLEAQLELIEARFNLFRQNGILTDVILEAGGKEFPVHRSLLAAGSIYFERLLAGPYKEANTKLSHQEIDPEVLSHVLDALYFKDPFTKDFVKDLEIAEALIFYQITTFNIQNFTRNLVVLAEHFLIYLEFLSHLQLPDIQFAIKNLAIPQEHFLTYLNFLCEVSKQIPDDVIDNTGKYLKPGIDLSDFPHVVVKQLLLSKYYMPSNIIDFVEMINDLIKKGHSTDLYELLDYNLCPYELKRVIPKEFAHRGPVPRTKDIYSTGDYIVAPVELVITSVSASDGRITALGRQKTNLYYNSGDHKEWLVIVKDKMPLVGDLITLNVEGGVTNYEHPGPHNDYRGATVLFAKDWLRMHSK